MKKFLQPIRYFWKWSAGLLVLIIVLAFGYGAFGKESAGFEAVWKWIDPVSAIASFVITIAILYNQARESWEDDLEKRLSIEFVYGRDVIARVEDAYLAGESDIRAWSQQLGKQMMGEMKMDMNWDEEKPKVIKAEGGYVKSYKVKIYLAENPLEKESNDSFMQFKDFHSRYRHSTVQFSDTNPRIVWKRQGDSDKN
ncbi:MAG: hypothetical protein Kow0027_22780 [Saprospiraceae bacterium]